MYHISDIEPVINSIPECMYELPPEETHEGDTSAISTAWEAETPHKYGNLAEMNVSDREEEEGEGEEGDLALEEIFEIPPQVDLDRARPALDGNEGQRIRRAVQMHGIDALAWYVTFHARNAQWGIYIPLSSISYMASEVLSSLSCHPGTKLLLAIRALHQHELYHFAVDYYCSQIEALTGKPCHSPGRNLRDRKLGYYPLEEGLANAFYDPQLLADATSY